MTDSVAMKASKDRLIEPVEPGTSATYVKGPAFRRYRLWFTLLTLGMTAIWGAVLGVLLPNQVQMLTFGQFFTGANAHVDLQQLTVLQQAVQAGTTNPTAAQSAQLGILGEFNAARAQALSVITAIGVAMTMLVQPLVGIASDRTRSRWGRRAPWILSGVVIGGLLLAVMPVSPTLAVLGLVFALAQASLNAALGPLNTTVADRVPDDRRGTVSALGGFGSLLGGVLGGVLAGVLFGTVGLGIYFGLAALIVFLGVLFVLLTRDRSSKDLAVPRFAWRAFFVSFTVALRTRDFRWVWIARILLTFGYTVSTALSLYMLQSYVRPALSAAQATSLVPLFGLIGIPFMIIAVFVAGRISDRIHRRKPFVIAASVLMTASMLVPIISPTVPGMLVQAVLASLAFGIYLPVDQALFIDVLPDPRSAGRDLGVASLGTNLGQALGPLLAGAVVALTGGYLGVWIAAGVLVIFAALAILPVRGAR